MGEKVNSPSSRALAYAIIVTLGGLVFGLDLGVIAGTFGYIKQQFGLTDLQIGTVGAAPGFGAIFALLFAGTLADKLGRKRTIQLIALLYLASAVTSALAPNYGLLVAARFLGGLAFCSLALASMYIGEISPAHLRGRLVSINQFNIVVGLTVAYLIDYWIEHAAQGGASWAASLNLQETAWRWMLGSEVPLALIWLLLVSIIPESPRWLVMVGREADARAAMAKLLPKEEISGEIDSIHQSMRISQRADTIGELLGELFSKHARKAAIIGITIAAVQPITGINAINTYAPMIFAQTGSADPLWQTVWLGVISLVAIIFAFLLIDRLGRRPVVIFGLLWCVVSLGLCTWGFHQARYSLDETALEAIAEELGSDHPEVVDQLKGQEDKVYDNDILFMEGVRKSLGQELADANRDLLIGKAAKINADLILFAILSFMAAFQFSIGPAMWVVLSEIFPTKLRGLAIPAAQLVTAVVNYFVQQFFPWQLSNMGARDIFLFYSLAAGIGMVALTIMLPETKNKSIEEIEAELSGKGAAA